MGLTIKDPEDLIRLLEKHADWRERRLRAMRSEELLALPEAFRSAGFRKRPLALGIKPPTGSIATACGGCGGRGRRCRPAVAPRRMDPCPRPGGRGRLL